MKICFATLIMLLSLVLISFNIQAGNPGNNAMDCVSASTNSENYDNLVFKNRCGYQIFVVWCGDLKSSKKNCGDGPRNSYFTQSMNIDAYGEVTASLDRGGSYSFAACEGKIGFGSEGIEHPADEGGSYKCTRTGSGN